MKNLSENRFLSDVSAISWEGFIHFADDINTLVNGWPSLLSLIIEKHAPLKEKPVTEKYRPGIEKNLKELMLARDRLKTAVFRSKSTILMDAYRQTHKRVNSLNVQVKGQYFTTKLSKVRGI